MRVWGWRRGLLCLWLCVPGQAAGALAQGSSDGTLDTLDAEIAASFQARTCGKALELAGRKAKAVEEAEAANGVARTGTAAALGEVAWYALFAREPGKALEAAERATKLNPENLTVQRIHAHALLFSNAVSIPECNTGA